jgi:PAS domain S-box-containing protein
MFRNISVRTKLSVLIILLVFVTVVTAGYISYSIRLGVLEENYLRNLNALADLKIEKIHTFLQQAKTDLELLRNMDALKNGLTAGSDEDLPGDSLSADSGMAMDMGMGMADLGMGMTMDMDMALPGMDMADDGMAETQDITAALLSFNNSVEAEDIFVTDLEGKILHSTQQERAFDNIRRAVNGYDDSLVPGALEGLFFSKVFQQQGGYHVIAGAPVVNALEEKTGLAFIQLDLSAVYETLAKDLGFGETIETLLVQKQKNRAVFLNTPKYDNLKALDDGVFFDEQMGGAMKQAAMGEEGKGYAIDYRGEKTLAVRKYIAATNWGLVVKADMSELHADAFVVVKRFALFGSIILIVSSIIAIAFAQFFVNPLLSLKESLASLAKGNLPSSIEKQSDDEVGQMSETTNELVQALRRTATFAEKIGKGDLKAEYQSLGADDMLGNALVNMRKNLLETEQQDKERNWIVTGVAEISEILRAHDTIDALGDAVIAFITEKIGAVQGAFYVLNDDNPKDPLVELKAAYAYHKKKYLNGTFKYAQGLVGQAVAEQDKILRTEIPQDYVTITSGILGDKRPECILITPLIANEKVFGVVEFAGFHKFNSSQIKFVEEISLILARTIFNIKVNERTRKLLEESQKMSNELQEQQEVLRQNAEEMAATQEELRRTNQRLEDQIEEVNRTRNRMQLLLENASEVIAIYEEEGSIRYISPSVERILGYAQNDMIGQSDKIHVHPDGLDAMEQMFRAVIANPFESASAQYEYIKKDGEAIWVEATATNLLSDPAIQGIIVNTRDITERRRAEREERMRSKMQSLSENSPDLITRLTNTGEFFYINPMIENYTGQKAADFLNKTLSDVAIAENVKQEWIGLLREVEERKNTVSREMDFPSTMGERVMQINAIPEFDEENALESVLLVSHDITDRKQIELEIQSKNRKITESINYAKRIQSAILPNNAVIRQLLPDSFILYRARDVVSGDFPWFMNIGDTMYFAAVDCTGHGVPGALISLIGYFLLNDIIKSRKITDPGSILDALDKSVTKTLRQDVDNSQTKDGMDIALCKIELNTREITYAGAHRPLYYMNGGELEEIKGDKFPIGGGIYKNQTKFTSTKFKAGKGDSIFFCSDGFPDQFGGPDNRKFGPKRIRQIVQDNHKKSMMELHKIFDDEWMAWKGEQKQTDDVLMIGVRF